MEASLKEKTAKGLFWGGIGNGVMQLLNLVFGIFLARLLSTTDYGMVAVLTIFSAMAGIFSESGFILALVNKKEVKHEEYNSVFWFNISIGASLYLILFLCAPFIADFYHTPELTRLARFQFLSFFIGSFGTAPTAYFFRNLMVKERSQIQIAAILISGITGVSCAYHGWGYWGIAVQTVVYVSTNTILLWIFSPWRPTFSFRFHPLLELLPFSSKLLFTSLFTHINNNIFSALLGRFYTIQQAGYYSQGSKWTTMGYSTIFGMINSVGQPVFREASEDRQRLQNIFRKLMRFTAFVSFPAMLGLAIVSQELIVISITEKWLPCVPYLRIFCITYMFYPIHTANLNAIKAMGRSGVYLKLEIIKKIMGLTLLLLTYHISVMAMAYSLILSSLLSQLINTWPNRKLLDYRYLEQLKDILPSILLAIFMGCCMWLVNLAHLPDIVTLVIQILIGAAVYLGGSALLKLDTFEYLWNVVKPKIQRKPWADNEE